MFVLFLAFVTLSACGGNGDSAKRHSTDTTPVNGNTGETPPAASGTTLNETLPVADPSTYVGSNRVVHLAVLADGTTPSLDIWATRSFEYAPILLVEGLQYGDTSPVYGAPEGMSVVAVTSGQGPDSTPFANVFSANASQHYTHLLVFDRESGSGTGLLLEDQDPTNVNVFPEVRPGQALVQFYAYQLTLNPLSTGASFEQRLAGVEPTFQLGIRGLVGCAPQPRQTDAGFAPAILGGTQRPAFDLDPGTTTFTFHQWGSNDKQCADDSVIDEVAVTVTAGERAWILLHSRDGKSIEALFVPLA